MYEPRTYRHWVKDHGLVSFPAVIKETDLLIRASCDLRDKALEAVKKYRSIIEDYIESHPNFSVSLEPVTVKKNSPPLIAQMADAALKAGVGPMAAVAGAIAEAVGRELLEFCEEVIVENGGDIFMKTSIERYIGIYAGESALTGKIAFSIQPEETPMGICTSSGTVGHSLSFGTADAVIAFSESTVLADAAATAIGNLVCSTGDIPEALKFSRSISGLKGAAIIKDDHFGLSGKVKLAELEG